jgi:4-hydroxy-tetrahydrodipicolinate synthase
MLQVPTSDPHALADHLQAVHDATGVGVVVQDYPVVSGVTIATSELLTAIIGCAFVVAVKSEAPPTSAAIAELTAGTDVPVFGGLGGLGLLDELMAGAAGAMTGFSHPEGLAATLSHSQGKPVSPRHLQQPGATTTSSNDVPTAGSTST